MTRNKQLATVNEVGGVRRRTETSKIRVEAYVVIDASKSEKNTLQEGFNSLRIAGNCLSVH